MSNTYSDILSALLAEPTESMKIRAFVSDTAIRKGLNTALKDFNDTEIIFGGTPEYSRVSVSKFDDDGLITVKLISKTHEPKLNIGVIINESD